MPNKPEKYTVLIIDDEPEILASLERALHFKYNVITTSHSMDVLSLLKNTHVDCIVLDIRMPGVNGIDLLKDIKFIYLHMPVIMMTGHGKEEDVIQALKYGAAGYVTKPIDIYLLISELEKSLATSKKQNKHPKIVLLDDDKLFLNKIKKSLESYPYDIYLCSNHKQALTVIKKEEIDVLVLSEKISDSPNLDFINKVRKIYDDIIFILVADVTDQRLAIEAINKNIFDYLKKPIKPEDLISAIERASYKIKSHQDIRVRNKKLSFKTQLLEKLNKKIMTQKVYLNDIVSSILNILIIFDAKGSIVMLNDIAMKTLGYDKKDISSLSIDNIYQGINKERLLKLLMNSVGGDNFEAEYTTKSGRKIPVVVSSSIIRTPDKKSGNIILAAQDISERKFAEKKVQKLESFDPLTKLANRSCFEKLAKESIAEVLNTGEELIFMVINLDDFKALNDRLGYNIGDRILVKAGHRIKRMLTQPNFIARLSGNEFIVLLKNPYSVSNKEIIASQIINKLNEPFFIKREKIYIAISIGIVSVPHHASNFYDILKCADMALHDVRIRGGNQFQVFSLQIEKEYGQQLKIESALHLALTNKKFYLVYQPIYDLKTMQIEAVEALIRWSNKELGMIGPDTFIPIAESNGLIIPITNWILQSSFEQFAKWRKVGENKIKLSVNLSAKQFDNIEYLLNSLKELCHHYNIPSSSVELEITETAIMQDIEQAIYALKKLRSLGFLISMDDFGTGYSSLKLLSRLPFSTLKIDRSFVEDFKNKKSQIIIKSIISLSKGLALNVIAEGIETEEQLKFLKALGCDYGQGFYLSTPKLVDELTVSKKTLKLCD